MRAEVIARLTTPGGGAALQVATVAEQQGADIVTGAALAAGAGLLPIREGVLDCLAGDAGPHSPAQASNRLRPVAWGYERPWRVRSLSLLSGQPLSPVRERALFDAWLGEAPGTLWLDLAASTALYGRWLAPRLAPRGGEVVALDLAWPMLRQAQRAIAEEGQRNLSLVRARAERLPFGTATLDGVLCGGSLNEFGPQGAPAALAEVQRALRPGGLAFFMFLLASEQPGWGQRLQRHVARPGGIAFWTLAGARQLFEGAGLTVEALERFGVVAFARLRRGER